MQILRNIDKSINIIKIFAGFVLLASFIFSGFVYYTSLQVIEENNNRVYLLNEGNILELIKSRDTDDNVIAEVKNHVYMFHEFFFNLDPDPKDIKTRIDKALHLIDESGKLLESERTENRYYHKMIEGSISSRISIDSILVTKGNNSDKYYVKVFGQQKLERTSKIILRNVVADCYLRKVGRTDNNPHGFLMENYQILNNQIIHEKTK